MGGAGGDADVVGGVVVLEGFGLFAFVVVVVGFSVCSGCFSAVVFGDRAFVFGSDVDCGALSFAIFCVGYFVRDVAGGDFVPGVVSGGVDSVVLGGDSGFGEGVVVWGGGYEWVVVFWCDVGGAICVFGVDEGGANFGVVVVVFFGFLSV